jgi:molybdenum cofactor guanylyltransferase
MIHCQGFVLTGGQSNRMGQHKALLPFGDRPLVVWVAETVRAACGNATLVGSSGTYSSLGFPVIEDLYPGQGPLAGIHAALQHSSAISNLILGCDMPYVTEAFLRWLLESFERTGAVITVPESDAFGYEPLCGVYKKECRSVIEDALRSGERSVRRVLARVGAQTLPRSEWKPFDPAGKLFRNLNTPGEYDQALADLLAGAGKIRQ